MSVIIYSLGAAEEVTGSKHVLEIDDVLGVALLQTMITVFSTFIILIVRILYHNRKKFSIGLLVAYILVILGVGSSSLIIMPKINADNYEQAKVYIEDGEYSEARAILNKMLRYKDSEELYNSIKYKDLKVGETLSIGTQLDKPDGITRKDLTWTVIKVEGMMCMHCFRILYHKAAQAHSYHLQNQRISKALMHPL